MEKIDWNDLQYFVCLVNQHTLTAAAETLNVQHTTVARRIEKLEQALNIKLFDRMGKRYHLTSEGELLFVQATKIQSQVHTFNRMAMSQNAMQGEVVISAPPVLANELILPFLSSFYQQYPDINLCINGDVNRINLHQKEADIALRIGRPQEESLVIRKLKDITYQLYAHPNYLEQLTRTNETKLLTQLQLVEFQGSKRLLAWTNQLKKTHNMPISFTSNDLYICQHAIAQQIGIGILPDLLASQSHSHNLIAINQYVNIKIPETLCTAQVSELYLVMHPDVRVAARVRAVADWLSELFIP